MKFPDLKKFFENRRLEKERWKETLEAFEDIRQGNTFDGEEVHRWVLSWGTKKELPRPQ